MGFILSFNKRYWVTCSSYAKNYAHKEMTNEHSAFPLPREENKIPRRNIALLHLTPEYSMSLILSSYFCEAFISRFPLLEQLAQQRNLRSKEKDDRHTS